MKWLLFIFAFFMLWSCRNNQEQNAQGEWIKGTEQEKLETIENQFRGFDMAMQETSYRYQELYWAGQDENWQYAQYQVDKIEKAITNGLQRRPKRAASAQHFLNTVLPNMESAIKSEDTVIFRKSFNTMTINCNSCHAMEKVPYFTVKKPLDRQSPIRKQ